MSLRPEWAITADIPVNFLTYDMPRLDGGGSFSIQQRLFDIITLGSCSYCI